MYKDEVLENENRSRIYRAIESNPGIHLRELQRILDIPLTTLDYHISYMHRKNIIKGERDGANTKYYSKPFDDMDKPIISSLRQKKLREIVLYILVNQKVSFNILLDYFKLPRSTLSLYLKNLVDGDVVSREKIGYESFYVVNDEDRVAKILIAYRPNLLDKLIDNALNTWLETYIIKEKLVDPIA